MANDSMFGFRAKMSEKKGLQLLKSKPKPNDRFEFYNPAAQEPRNPGTQEPRNPKTVQAEDTITIKKEGKKEGT